jgi:hypothetical protein
MEIGQEKLPYGYIPPEARHSGNPAWVHTQSNKKPKMGPGTMMLIGAAVILGIVVATGPKK